ADLERGRVDMVIGQSSVPERGRLTQLPLGWTPGRAKVLQASGRPDSFAPLLESSRNGLAMGWSVSEDSALSSPPALAKACRLAVGLGSIGVAYDIDAAGASFLLALELAARSLANRRADLAVAGAVSLEAGPGARQKFIGPRGVSVVASDPPDAADSGG